MLKLSQGMIMRINRFLPAFLAAIFLWSCAATDDATAQAAAPYEPMEIFAPLNGKTLRGEGTAPDGSPIVDIAKWKTILGGRAFQSTHRLEGGAYGGRTIFFYDEAAEEYIFHYFTTAGFHTTGIATPTASGFTVVEKVIGHPKYVEVISEFIIGGDDIRIASRHKDKDGVSTDGETMIYQEIDDHVLLFFDEADAFLGKRTEVKDAHDRYKDDDH